jgi:hypothetical protein
MAALPTLASFVYTATESPTQPPKYPRLPTACPSIDVSLKGGFNYGSISCISSESESGAKELSYSLIATHLFASEVSEASVVDTTNSFDVRRLHGRVLKGVDNGNGKAEAVKALERVRIMKAWDLVGVVECVGEVGEGLDSGSTGGKRVSMTGQGNVSGMRGTVGDSEDEDEMLDDVEPVSGRKSPPPASLGTAKPAQAEIEDQPRHLLVIDNITYVASPLLKANHVQGQSLLATFMRSLAHLTRTHNICTILHNATTTYPTTSSSEPTPSIFSSCTLRPALGKPFTYLLDTHLLLHRVPLTAADAKSVYAAHSAIPTDSRKLVSVLEVLQDRQSDRVGHWAAFRAETDGRLTSVSP